MTLQPPGDDSLTMIEDLLARLVADRGEDAAALWTALTRELGIAEAVLEAEGAEGGRQTWAIMEALGRASAWTPFLSSIILAGGALRRGGGALAGTLLPRIATGEIRAALAYLEPGRRSAVEPHSCRVVEESGALRLRGEKTVVLGGADADWLIVTACEADGGTSLFAVEAGQVERTPRDTLDGTRAANIVLRDVPVTVDAVVGARGDGLALLDRVLDEALVASFAAAAGGLRVMLDQTVEYIRQRRQFGRALSEFQVLQHRLVDMLVDLERAISLAQVALAKLDGSADERREAVSGAKVLIAGACRSVSQGAVQLHGGIGTTEELPLAVYFRRALMFEHLFGSADHHLKRYQAAAAAISARVPGLDVNSLETIS